MDDEGFVYIVDRWKDMYISGGENVYPAEVENVLYQLPEVAEAAIIGVPERQVGRGRSGRRWRSSRAPRSTGRPSSSTASSRLAKFKVPNDIAIVDALPRNATGKVLKRELRARFVDADAPRIS